jgi:type IV secretory pathway VirB10-like protein
MRRFSRGLLISSIAGFSRLFRHAAPRAKLAAMVVPVLLFNCASLSARTEPQQAPATQVKPARASSPAKRSKPVKPASPVKPPARDAAPPEQPPTPATPDSQGASPAPAPQRAPVDIDPEKLQPYNLPPASRQRMRLCGERWRDLKMAGKSAGLTWRSFAEKCLPGQD